MFQNRGVSSAASGVRKKSYVKRKGKKKSEQREEREGAGLERPFLHSPPSHTFSCRQKAKMRDRHSSDWRARVSATGWRLECDGRWIQRGAG